MHGGASTGPRTAEGLERSRQARLKHGRYSPCVIAQRAEEAKRADHERRSTLEARAYVLRLLRRGR